jgi:CDP-glycerol glycerophosphotransferase (TagB/SpsB family)
MTTPGLDVYQLKRSKGVGHYAHILHAVDDATSYRLFGLDYFDSILLSGEYQKKHIRIVERARGLKEKDLVVVGCPYLDVLNKKISLLADKSDTEITILVAPSWGPSGILSKYGEQLLAPLVDSGFDIIVRPHPQTKTSEKLILESLMEMYKNNANLSWDFERENLGTLSKADVMISDFSGVIFDYAFLFNRPFLYVNAEFDAKPYDAWDIEEKPWKFRILPEIGTELQESQFSIIKQVLFNVMDNEELRSNREKAKDTAWQYRGESGSRVYEYLVFKKNEMYPE